MGTYYVNNITGANTNNGTSSGTAWKECPGTKNPTGSTSGWITIPVGSTIYFAAGQEWNKGIELNNSGNVWFSNPTQQSERITLTSDSTSTRAIFDFNGGNTDTAKNSSGIWSNVDYITFQYLEVREISTAGGGIGFYIGNNSATDYNKILYCYIHDIIDTNDLPTENFSYGIIISQATETEIAYNIIKNVDKKLIGSNESYGGSHLIHHNTCYNEATFTETGFDHGIVVSSLNGGNSVYNNIIWNASYYYTKNIAINLASADSNNKVYNNIIRGFNVGIGLRNNASSGNIVYHNTIYMISPILYEAYHMDDFNCWAGLYVEADTGCFLRNNIVYYCKYIQDETGDWGSPVVWIYSGSSITIQNNLFYYDSGSKEVGATGNIEFRSISYMENTWNGSNGNVWTNNTIASPGFAGGSYPVSNLPDGFDGNWHPNNTGLQLTASIPGDNTVGATYATDIQGNARVNYDVGAYEYQGDEISPKGLASSEPFRIGAITHKQNPRKIHSKH